MCFASPCARGVKSNEIVAVGWQFHGNPKHSWVFHSYEETTKTPLDHMTQDTNWSRPDVDAVSLYQSAVSSTCPQQLLCCHSISWLALQMSPSLKIFFPLLHETVNPLSPTFLNYEDLNHFLPLLHFSLCSLFQPGCSHCPLREQLTWSKVPVQRSNIFKHWEGWEGVGGVSGDWEIWGRIEKK